MKDCNTCIYNHLLASDTEAAREPCVSCVDYDHYVERLNHAFVELPEPEMPCVECPGEEYDHNDLELEEE